MQQVALIKMNHYFNLFIRFKENSRYLIELNQQAYTHNEVRNLLATIIQDKIDETVTILLPFIQILDAIYILVKYFY